MKHSLQARLSLVLSIVTLGVTLIAGSYAFYSAFQEAHEMQDDNLLQVAQHISRAEHKRTHDNAPIIAADPESKIHIQWLSGVPAAGELPIPTHLPAGLHTINIDGDALRVAIAVDGADRLAVAQAVDLRDEIALDSAWRTVLPLLGLVPLQIVLVVALTRRMLRPLRQLANDLQSRSGNDLQALHSDHLPSELTPFIDALNAQLQRVDDAAQAQQRFIANAAHELRSPLAAMGLQLERLSQTHLSPEALERLNTLRQGADRQRQLLDQLLGLARAQAPHASKPNASCSVMGVITQVLEQTMPLALARDIDLGLARAKDVSLAADAMDVFTMLRNVVDNALRYSPAGATVDITVDANAHTATLAVCDNGPGIAAVDRAQALTPFVRLASADITGSGLGLSIVHSLVAKHGGELLLSDAPGGGLYAQLRLPLAQPGPR